MSVTTPDIMKQIFQYKAFGFSQKETARKLGIAWSTVKKHWGEETPEPVAPKQEAPNASFEEAGDTAKYSGLSEKRITTEKELIEHSGMDPLVWRVKKWGCGAWTTTAKKEWLVEKGGKTYKIKTPLSFNNWKVWAEFERLMPKPYFDGVKELFHEWAKPVKQIKFNMPMIIPKRDPIICVVGLFDAHFGKLCWGEESGEDSDLHIQETVYANAISDLLKRISHIKPDFMYWPIGNDFVHIDNDRNETTRGTLVATDSRYSKIIRTAFRAQAQGMARAAEVCPVKGFLVPGNHDKNGTQWLGLALDAKFNGSRSVEIDLDPRSRKYRKYGITMLGFTHGDKLQAANVNKLAGLIGHEQRQNLGGTLWSEWFTGHNHRKMKFEDTLQGTVVRSLESISAADDYHYDEGFTGARRAAEIYMYEKDGGYCGHWNATARSA